MPPAATTVRGRFADSSTRYSPTPTLSACRSSQACSSLTGISLRRPTRTRRTSGSICARQVSHDTPSASHACSTLRARAGPPCFRAAKVTAVRGDIGAIAVTDPNLHGPAKRLREEPVRARHWGAHLKGPRRAKPRGRPQAPDTCASLGQSPAPRQIIPLRSTRRDPAADARPCATTRPPAQQKASTDHMHGCAIAQRVLCELAFGVLSSLVLAGVFVRAVGAVVGVAAGCARCWLLGAVRWHAVA